jgi:hypothetical protein
MVAIGKTLLPEGTGEECGGDTDVCTDSRAHHRNAENRVPATHNHRRGVALSRWLTRDPIGYQGGINLYGYVDSSPVGNVDAEGLDPASVVAGVKKGGRDDVPGKMVIVRRIKHHSFNAYIYLLENKEGRPLHGSGYSVEEHISPPSDWSTSEGNFIPTNYGEVVDFVGYKKEPGHNITKTTVSYQTFTVRFRGKFYQLSTEHKLVVVVKCGTVTKVEDRVVKR